MPKLTKLHYEWLSTDIASMITPDKRKAFIDSIVRFDDNPLFHRQTFEEKMLQTIEDIWADEQAEQISPELYKLYDGE
jgi:hypothetical protein